MRKGMTCLFLVLLTSSLLVASDKRTPAGGIGKEAGVPDPSNPFRWVGRLGDARFLHDGRITSVLPLPNWKEARSSVWNRTLSSAWDETFRLWDPKTGKELGRFEGVGDVGDTKARRWGFKTGGGIDRIYLLDGGKRVLTRMDYSGYGWELWDRKSRKSISTDFIRGSYGRIIDVDERTGKVVGIANRIPKASESRVFTVQIDHPIEKRIIMGSTGGRIPDWIRFTQNPDQFVSARCYAKTIWSM